MKRSLLLAVLLAVSRSATGVSGNCPVDTTVALAVIFQITFDHACELFFPSDSDLSIFTKDTVPPVPEHFRLNENKGIVARMAAASPQPKSLSTQGIGAADAVADMSGRYMYVASDGSNEVSAYRVD